VQKICTVCRRCARCRYTIRFTPDYASLSTYFRHCYARNIAITSLPPPVRFCAVATPCAAIATASSAIYSPTCYCTPDMHGIQPAYRNIRFMIVRRYRASAYATRHEKSAPSFYGKQRFSSRSTATPMIANMQRRDTALLIETRRR